MCSAVDAPNISLEHTVFVAFEGEDLNIAYKLKTPSVEDNLTCFDPNHKQIYQRTISAVTGKQQLELKNLKISGDYYCQYQTVKVHWFLRVTAVGYKEPVIPEYTEFTIVAIVTGVLLIFSVLGSVYVFRGHWKEKLTECGGAGKTTEQSREEEGENKETDSVDVTAVQSTSFYASLEPRPRSIYDVLDHSPGGREEDQNTAKPEKKEVTKKAVQTTKDQDEGIFESVYENF